MPMESYCDFSLLTFLLISDINEWLPGTQLELLHVELFEWYEDHGSFLNQMISAKRCFLIIQIFYVDSTHW